MTTNAGDPLKLFYCYAHEDKALRDALDIHLTSMKRHDMITVWYDREISPGTMWEREIDKHLTTSDIILLLVSAPFLASDYCYGIEMKKAMERHEAGTARVVPIILRPVDWEDAPFSQLQVLPTGAKPVTRWSDRDEAFEDIAKALRKVVKDLRVSLKTAEEWVNEGIALYDLKRYEDALAAYDQAIRLNPNDVLAYFAYVNRGGAFYNLKRYEGALTAYNQAIRLDPNDADAYYNKGNSLFGLGRYEDALVAYEQAIRLDPNYAIAYYNKGVALQRLNREREAQAAFKRAGVLGF